MEIFKKIIKRISKILLLLGGINLGLMGASNLLGLQSFNLILTLLSFVKLSNYINWVYLLIGITSIYLVIKCFKDKDY
ncbi:MAG: hypothetical protein WC758_07785 [Candidatus Woesearchaeota archaeon]|jgi:uncharacterized membrane protein YuzA (DUF378 family)